MYWLRAVIGAPPEDPAKREPDHSRFARQWCLCRSGNSCRSGLTSGSKPLNVRQWACAGCGAVHDRDLNAAKNISPWDAGRV